MRDGGQMEGRVDVNWSVVAEELTVRPLGLNVPALVQIPLEDVLGVSRHQDVIGNALNYWHRLAPHGAEEGEFVRRRSKACRANEVRRVGTHGIGYRQRFFCLHMRQIDGAKVAR